MKNVIDKCSKIRHFASIGLKLMVKMVESEENERERESKNRESTKYHENGRGGKESDRNARKILALLGETKYGISRYQ